MGGCSISSHRLSHQPLRCLLIISIHAVQVLDPPYDHCSQKPHGCYTTYEKNTPGQSPLNQKTLLIHQHGAQHDGCDCCEEKDGCLDIEQYDGGKPADFVDDECAEAED